MLFKGKISSTLVGCQGAVCVESLAKWPPALITATSVLGPGGNCSREYIDSELFPLVVVYGLLIVVASLSCCEAQALGMWASVVAASGL